MSALPYRLLTRSSQSISAAIEFEAGVFRRPGDNLEQY